MSVIDVEALQPPMDGRWILAFDPQLTEWTRTRPWVLATRCDDGFHDTEGHPVEVQRWAYLPDPQPKPTSWTPPLGRIAVSRGSIAETGWDGWIVDFVQPDGAYYDEREPLLYHSEAAADEAAGRYQRLYSLPITKDRTPPPGLPSNVVSISAHRSRFGAAIASDGTEATDGI